MSTHKTIHQIAYSKKAFHIFVCSTIVVLASPIRATQVCDIPPGFEQKTTHLTCRFDVDIKALKKDIAVLHYDNNDPHNPETVLYSAKFQGEIEYLTRPGFTIIGKVTNILVLRVDRVTRGRIGRYECHILPSVAGDVEPCNLVLREGVNDAIDTSTHMDTTIKQNSPEGSEDHGENISFFIPLIIGLGILLLMSAGIVTLIIILCKRMPKTVNGNATYTPANTGSMSNGKPV